MVATILSLLFVSLISGAHSSKPLNLSGVKICDDVDELPAFAMDEKWASLYEVIAPYHALCRVPTPVGYTTREPWPKCLWELPMANIPKAILWQEGHIKSTQSWLKITGDKVQLPRTGGSLAAGKFLDILPDSIDMKNVHNVLDEGAGVCGLAAEIMVTMTHRPVVISYAPHDSHSNQVQLCLERGVPAIIFHMARYQFPVPPGSFDMVTCKWCWHWIAAVSMGQWLLEVDRVLRPGGYFVFYASVWQTHNFKEQMEFWASAVGWVKITKGNSKDLAAYQKPSAAIAGSTAASGFPLCPPDESRQPSFRRFHVPCRHPAVERAPQAIEPAAAAPHVAFVMQLMALMPGSVDYTNVMDTNAGDGSFGEAIRQLMPNAWTLSIQPVMAVEYHHKEQGNSSLNYAGLSNFVTSVGHDGLPGIFSQGRVGLYHDWCYMFPCYPRAFDLIHVSSLTLGHDSCMPQAVLEIDRLLRPGGYVVLSGPGVAQAVNAETMRVLDWAEVQHGGVDLGGGAVPLMDGAVLVARKLGGVFNMQ